MSQFSFKTINAAAEGIYKEKASKFMAFAYPASSEAQVKERIAALKKKYFDAHHHCFAFVLGADKSKARAFDDGEPAHTAGDPILGQIRSRDLTNILVVVVRYFGGTKLGVGGLRSAYKAAAADVLAKANIVEVELTTVFLLRYNYVATAEVMRWVKEFDLTIQHQQFGEQGHLEVSCKVLNREKFMDKLKQKEWEISWQEQD